MELVTMKMLIQAGSPPSQALFPVGGTVRKGKEAYHPSYVRRHTPAILPVTSLSHLQPRENSRTSTSVPYISSTARVYVGAFMYQMRLGLVCKRRSVLNSTATKESMGISHGRWTMMR